MWGKWIQRVSFLKTYGRTLPYKMQSITGPGGLCHSPCRKQDEKNPDGIEEKAEKGEFSRADAFDAAHHHDTDFIREGGSDDEPGKRPEQRPAESLREPLMMEERGEPRDNPR